MYIRLKNGRHAPLDACYLWLPHIILSLTFLLSIIPPIVYKFIRKNAKHLWYKTILPKETKVQIALGTN